MMSKFATPQLDQLESGPWPSFVSDIKQEAAHRAANANNVEYQIPVDCPEDLLGVLERCCSAWEYGQLLVWLWNLRGRVAKKYFFPGKGGRRYFF